MEFFDKKQDVIDIQLTRYGRQLLSRGLFKPTYYAFSDDEVLYDQRWVTGSNQELQSSIEERIQENTPRIKTLNSKENAELTIFNAGGMSVYGFTQNIIDLYNFGNDIQDHTEFWEKVASGILDPDFADSEKLLKYLLGNKQHSNNFAPAWNLIFYHGAISSSSGVYNKNDIKTVFPQINVDLTDIYWRTKEDQDIFNLKPHLMDIVEKANEAGSPSATGDNPFPSLVNPGANYLNLHLNTVILPTGSITLEKDFIFLSLEEANVNFTKENFSLEVFEVTSGSDGTNTETLKKLLFYGQSGLVNLKGDAVEAYFEIEYDDDIDGYLACSLIRNEEKLKTQNIYNTDIFGCGGGFNPPTFTSNVNVYNNLDFVEPEETC